MNSKDLWKSYDAYTLILSNNCRKLAFSSVAIIWILKDSKNLFCKELSIALLFIVMFFVADVLQYFISALILGVWIRVQEKSLWKEKQTIEGDFDKPVWIDYPAKFLWISKVIFLLISYFFIGKYIF